MAVQLFYGSGKLSISLHNGSLILIYIRRGNLFGIAFVLGTSIVVIYREIN
jgi:hypothetical protein